jgi:hypothetical protein
MIYESIGKLKISGCAVKRVIKKFETYFPVGSKAWIKKKAKIGKLETIFIKKVYRTISENYSYQGIQPVITYVDTFNRVWLEDELTWEENAIDFAKIHWIRVRNFAENQLINNCPPEPPCGT